MRRSIPAEMITVDAVKAVLKNNSDKEIKDSLDSETIERMCKAVTGIHPGGTTSALACMRVDSWDKADTLSSIILIDSLTERVLRYGDAIMLQVLDGDRMVYCSMIDTESSFDYQADNLGSGRADTGKYYLSLCVYREGEEDEEEWLAQAITYDGKDVEVDNVVEWTDSELATYYVYSKEKQCFVPYYNA